MGRTLDRLRRWASRDVVDALRRQEALARLHALPDRVVGFDYHGRSIRFHVPDGDLDFIQTTILLNRTFFEEPALRHLRGRIDLAGRTVLDVGANIGNHTVFFASVCGAAACLSFEPSPYAFRILERNRQLNDVGGRAIPSAVAAHAGVVSFARQSPTNSGATVFRPGGPDAIPCCTLDSLGLTEVGLVKIDVEGGTAAVLRGGMDLLSAHKPPLMIEILRAESSDCAAVLNRLGYRRTADFGERTYLYE